jgi:hypothetical protein
MYAYKCIGEGGPKVERGELWSHQEGGVVIPLTVWTQQHACACPKSEPRDKKKIIKHFSNKNCLKDANKILKYDGTCIVHLQTYYFNTSSGLFKYSIIFPY